MKKIIALIVILILGVVGFVWGWPMYQLHFSKVDLKENKLIYVATGTTLDELALQLAQEKIIDENKFKDFAAQLDFDDSKIEPGKYEVKTGMKIKNLIYGFKNGNQEIKDVKITFNNCVDIYELAGKVAPSIEADSAEIVNYISDNKTIEKFGFRKETMMSLFLPDTYEVGEWDMSAEEFVDFMAEQWKAFWTEERKAKREKINLSESQVATLASILEAEQGIFSQEWSTIAGVYLNRLESGMKLQSDPTAKFCWGNELAGIQRLLNEHMAKDCPYNTYLYAGLPPGPIRIPSKKAIDAVLNAEDHKYLYFCAKDDNSGLHAFAETYDQHLENARKFWKYMDGREN
ncbi:MAG: endolytic transglycosylase MltG [Crocinitomicaceae bacterium]|nr:endolytic transglycosylase MltG [Crocinitomicaceae bacterium]